MFLSLLTHLRTSASANDWQPCTQPSPDKVISHLCQMWVFSGWSSFCRLGVSRSVQSVILFEPYKETGIPGLIQ